MKTTIKYVKIILGIVFLLSALSQFSNLLYGINNPMHIVVGSVQAIIGFFLLKSGINTRSENNNSDLNHARNEKNKNVNFEDEKEKASEWLVNGTREFIEYFQAKQIDEQLLREFLKTIEGNGTYEAMFMDAMWLNPKNLEVQDKIDAIKNECMYLFLTWNKYPNSNE